jgi:hypothetical protein
LIPLSPDQHIAADLGRASGFPILDHRTLSESTTACSLHPRGAGWTVRLHEKGGKEHAMPCHHALAEAFRAYIDVAGIAEDRKGWLFRTPPPRQGGRDRSGNRLCATRDAWSP